MKSSGKKKKVNFQVCFQIGSFGNPVQASSLCHNSRTRVKLGIHLLPPPHMIGTNRAGGRGGPDPEEVGASGEAGHRCSTGDYRRGLWGRGFASILWASLSSRELPPSKVPVCS